MAHNPGPNAKKKAKNKSESARMLDANKLLDPLEAGMVTFACDLYPDYSSSFIGTTQAVRSRAKDSAAKKRVA